MDRYVLLNHEILFFSIDSLVQVHALLTLQIINFVRVICFVIVYFI